ncbi:MAG: hypothetical protein HY288_01365 [Planctomycetia bacterium]|nr:hypothetical protein [Planctomycetia bacterium]
MRYLNFLSGLGAVLLALSASIITAGPWEREGRSKVLGDTQDRGIRRQANRAYSYAPANAVSAPAPAAEESQAAVPSTQEQDASTRSFSYQAAPSNNALRMNRRATRNPGFCRADRKVLNEN